VQKLRQNQKDITIQNEKIMEENYNLVSQNDMLQKTVTQLNELIFTFKNDYQEKTTEMSEFMKQFKAIEAKLGAYKDMFDKGIYKMVLLRNESR
jgi:predicted  nucleic acid-binding Zn-ribbon protein